MSDFRPTCRRCGTAEPGLYLDGLCCPCFDAAPHLTRTHPEEPPMTTIRPCPLCHGAKATELPVPAWGDTDLVSCPLCCPWPDGFPGYGRPDGSWIVPPYGPGGRGTYNPPPTAPETALSGPETPSPF